MTETLDEKILSGNGSDAQPEEMGMAELLAQEESAGGADSQNGSFITVRVVSFNKDGALVNTGSKAEALIPKSEFGEEAPFAVGDSVQVLRDSSSRVEGYLTVSWKAARDRTSWREVQELHKNKTPIPVKVKALIKGGLTVECLSGLTGFMPASQVDVRMSRNLEKWVGQTLTAYIMEFDVRKNNLVLSRKTFVAEENAKKKAETLQHIKVGDVRQGVVTGITTFGAFVDIGGIEGLLHIGELEWAHTKKVSDVLKVGQQIDVKIIKMDPQTEKVSLSRKSLMPHPWENVEQRFPAGAVVKGKITSFTDFGVFLELAPQVEGLLHQTEISWKHETQNPKELFKVGQELEVKVLSANREKEKISLSLKRVGENPWDSLMQKYPEGSTVKVTVTSLAPFGAFARLEAGMEGLIHISDFSWAKRVRHPEDVLKPGQEIEAKVLEIDPQKEKISLGLKQLKANPFETYAKGKKVKGVVSQVNDAGAVVALEPDVEGFVPYGEVSTEKFEKVSDVLKEGQEIEGKIMLVDAKERKIHISIRQLDRDLQRAAVRKYSGNTPGPALGDLFE